MTYSDLKLAVDRALHDGTTLFTLPQLATHLEEGLATPGMARALRERIDQLEAALGWFPHDATTP